MKKIIFSAILLSLMNLVFAQTSLINSEEKGMLIDGVEVQVISTVLRGDLDEVNKSIVRFSKEQLDIRLREKASYFIAEKIVIEQITDLRGDFIVHSFNQDNVVSLSLSYRIGYDVYLSSDKYPEEFEKLKEFLEYYVFTYYDQFLPRYVKNVSKDLSALEKQHKGSASQVKKSDRIIAQSGKKIKQQEKKIEKLLASDSITTAVAEEKAACEARISDLKKEQERSESIKRINQELMDKIEPRMEVLMEEIGDAKITIIEVKAKLSTYS